MEMILSFLDIEWYRIVIYKFNLCKYKHNLDIVDNFEVKVINLKSKRTTYTGKQVVPLLNTI